MELTTHGSSPVDSFVTADERQPSQNYRAYVTGESWAILAVGTCAADSCWLVLLVLFLGLVLSAIDGLILFGFVQGIINYPSPAYLSKVERWVFSSLCCHTILSFLSTLVHAIWGRRLRLHMPAVRRMEGLPLSGLTCQTILKGLGFTMLLLTAFMLYEGALGP